MFSASLSGSGMNNFGNKSTEELIRNHMMQNEPPMEHAIIRLFVNVSHLLTDHDNPGGPININNIRILTGVPSDMKKTQVTIVIPCGTVDDDVISALNDIMKKYQYSYHRQCSFPEHREYQVDYIKKES